VVVHQLTCWRTPERKSSLLRLMRRERMHSQAVPLRRSRNA
jgi:hypothetical protein